MFIKKSSTEDFENKSLEIRSFNHGDNQLYFLRIVVLTLGEIQHFGWWKSQFLAKPGINFLDRIFPRTKFVAAIRSASRVAQLTHDTSIGRGEVLHLFRMPSVEQNIENYLSENGHEFEKEFLPKLSDRDHLLHILVELANGALPLKQAGPVQLSQAEWGDISSIATIYYQGFINKTPVYPYFLG